MSSHQMQGNKRTINDAEGRTLLNSLIETPCAPENTPKRRWKKNFLVAHSQDSTPKTALNVSENSSTNEEVVHKHPDLSILKPPSRSDVRTNRSGSQYLKHGLKVIFTRIVRA
ncbi:hypothetical protein HanRHA438_Chr03g0141751 [Helianthus annuus]|nr:hypothetical protein HanRHA438_Chr03g0141751 [Helianthus annuus]